MIAFDTNILFYMIDAHDREKHCIAQDLVNRGIERRGEVCLAWQVLGEFYRSTTAKRKLSPSEARSS